MFRFTIRDLLWLTTLVAMACVLGISVLCAARWRDEAARYRTLSDYRLQQFEFLFDEWQKQKPKTIKHTHKDKYIIETVDGRTVTLKP